MFGQEVQQFVVAGRVVGDAGLGEQGAGVVDDGDVVVAFRPVDAAEHGQAVLPHSIVYAGHEHMRVTRRPNPRTRRSAISVAVRDTSALQGRRSVYRALGLAMKKRSTLEWARAVTSTSGRPPRVSWWSRRHRAVPLLTEAWQAGETEASARRPRHLTKLTSTRMFAVVRRLRPVALSGGLTGHGRIRPCPAPTHHRSLVDGGAGLRASLGDWRGPRRPLPVQASRRILVGSATSCLHPGLGKRGCVRSVGRAAWRGG